jgi:hypothetical protein
MPMINHPHTVPQTAKRSSFDRQSSGERPHASVHGRASRHRAIVLLFVFAIFAAGLAIKFAMGAAITFNHFR